MNFLTTKLLLFSAASVDYTSLLFNVINEYAIKEVSLQPLHVTINLTSFRRH